MVGIKSPLNARIGLHTIGMPESRCRRAWAVWVFEQELLLELLRGGLVAAQNPSHVADILSPSFYGCDLPDEEVAHYRIENEEEPDVRRHDKSDR